MFVQSEKEVVHRYHTKQVLLETFQNSQENIRAGDSIVAGLRTSSDECF